MLAELEPELALVYGDTNSTLAGALAAAQAGIPVGHVEAGMRSFDRTMPEELNRVLTDHASDLLLCSTPTAVANLEREGARGETHLVGDVMADVSLAFQRHRRRSARASWRSSASSRAATSSSPPTGRATSTTRSGSRRSWACSRPCRQPVVFPVHPRTRARLEAAGPRAVASTALTLLPPLGYLDFLELARHARAVLTDSGGVQKEAYLLGVPCVTLRDYAPNGSRRWRRAGTCSWTSIRDAALAALERRPPAERPELYGGGHAAERVAEVLAAYTARL